MRISNKELAKIMNKKTCIKTNIPYYYIKLGLPNQVMPNTIASHNPSNHTCTEMNQEANLSTSSLTSLPQTQQQYVEVCFPIARRNTATGMSYLFSLI